MKKKILLVLALLLFTLTGCAKTTYSEIKLDELGKKIENKESFALVIGSETCSACEAYRPIMEQVISKYNLTIYYINIYPLTTEQKAKLVSYVYYSNTPTTVFFTDGEVKDTHNNLVGAVSYDKVVARLIEMGYIKNER